MQYDEMYKQVVENANEGFLIAQDGMVKYCNPRILTMTGYSREELYSEPFLKFIHPDDRALVLERHMARLRGDNPGERYQFRLLRKPGDILWVQIGAVLSTWEGRPASINFLTDIHELKRIELDLSVSEDKFETLFRESPVMMAITTLKDGTILDANEIFLKQLGFEKSEVIGKTTVGIGMFSAETRSRVIEAVAENGSVRNLELSLLTKSGREMPSLICTEIISIPGEDCLLSTIVDLTEIKTAEQEKLRMQSQVIQAGKLAALGTMSAGIAHELNNPLAIVKGFSEILSVKMAAIAPDDKEIPGYLNKIVMASKRMTEIIDHIREYSRESSRDKRENIPPGTLISNSLIFLETRIRNRNIRLDIQVEDGLPNFWVNKTQMESVLQNLIVNAIDALESGKSDNKDKRIRIAGSLSENRKSIVFEVSDNGPGIPSEIIDKIFDPFFTTKEAGKGTGLGLSLTQRILADHHGVIRVESDPGHGTRFTIVVPIDMRSRNSK